MKLVASIIDLGGHFGKFQEEGIVREGFLLILIHRHIRK